MQTLADALTLAANPLAADAIREMITKHNYTVTAKPGVLVFLGPQGEEFETSNEPAVLTDQAGNGKMVAVNDGAITVDFESADGIEFESWAPRTNADHADRLDPFGFFAELAGEDFYQGLSAVSDRGEAAEVEGDAEETESSEEQDSEAAEE